MKDSCEFEWWYNLDLNQSINHHKNSKEKTRMAERFSRFRDAGTGIQVFLPPVPPVGSASLLHVLLLPVGMALGIIRTLLVILFCLLWLTLNLTIGHLGRRIRSIIHSFFGRILLFVIGFNWISEETISLRGRGRANQSQYSTTFSPKKGDIIMCNWSSWIDVLLLTIKFNPVFVRPVVKPGVKDITSNANSTSTNANKRRQGAASRGQQHAQMKSDSPKASSGGTTSNQISGEERLVGWNEVSFPLMVLESGLCPPSRSTGSKLSLEEVIKKADGPVVLFPELVTSNNRGLLRFESILPHSWRSLYKATGAIRIGQGQSNLFIMSIKHEAPTAIMPSTTLSVPLPPFSPLPHLLRLCFSPSFYALSVRYLSEQESPTHPNFIVDVNSVQRENALTEKCADLMSSLCRLRRTNLGWQDKENFLTMYRRR